MYKVFKKKYNQIMRKLFILSFCILFAACAGNRTLDGETTKNWVKIVSSKVDNTGTVRDVCFLLNLSFYPETVYERVHHNPATCMEQCCWYSENKNVDFYFNDGFAKDLADFGTARRYNPDHIRIKMNYAPFLNRLSASTTSTDIISKDGVIKLKYEDVKSESNMLNSKFQEVNAKVYTDSDVSRGADFKVSDKGRGASSYKTISMSGVNRAELLAQAQAEEEKGRAHAEEIANIYTEVSNGEVIMQSAPLEIQTENLPKNVEIKQTVIKETEKKTDKAKEVIYDVQKTSAEETKVAVIEKSLQDSEVRLDALTLKQKLAYERKQAVNLLKRFYGEEIDSYLRFLDKSKKEEGQVLLTNDRVWRAKKIGTPVYQVECKVNGKIALLGAEADTPTTEYPISCGTFIVDLDEKTVEAKDALAKKIAQKKY